MATLKRTLPLGFIGSLLLCFCAVGFAEDAPVAELLETARQQFYDAVEDETLIDPTLKLFERIEALAPKHAGRAQVYSGALLTLKGKHAFFPHTKIRWVKRGLQVMERGLKRDPDDLEALFVHGATCHHLPFFFRRGDDAHRSFRKIVGLLRQEVAAYDPGLIRNVIAFLLENAKLTDSEKAELRHLKKGLQLAPQ